MNRKLEIERIIELSEEELLVLLGNELSSNLSFEDTIESIRQAKRWLSINSNDLQKLICKNDRVQQAVDNSDVMLCMAIIDAITGFLTGIAAATVSALIIKRGLSIFCKEDCRKI